jgi:hypothetical protein
MAALFPGKKRKKKRKKKIDFTDLEGAGFEVPSSWLLFLTLF